MRIERQAISPFDPRPVVIATLILLGGCISTQDHGDRDADGGEMTADGSVGAVDGGERDIDSGVVVLPDGDVPIDASSASLPPFVDVSVASLEQIRTELVGGALRPTRVASQRIEVTAFATEGSVTFDRLGTVGPCDLYAPVGSGSWPPSTILAATPAPLPVEYVGITADGVPLTATSTGEGSVFAVSELEVGARIAITVSYPGVDPIVREVVLEAPVAVSSPTSVPSSSGYLAAEYVRGSDLAIAWDVTHDPAARQIVDVTGGSRGAARCVVTHGAGSVALTHADIDAHLLGSADVSLAINVFASTIDESVEGATRVRVLRSWSAPSIVAEL